MLQVFRISEDYDSDSDASDDDNKFYKKGAKKISKVLKESLIFTFENKIISLKW